METPISQAVAVFGSQQALAQACGMTQAAVSKWVRGHRVSAESAIVIERATNGAVTAAALRPDIFLRPLAAPPLPERTAA